MNSSNIAGIRPVILSGGFGKRLWPLSSDDYPKQFARLLNHGSLFLTTLKRVSDRNRYAAPIIIGNIEHIFFILADLNRLNITDAILFLEPEGRNTAAAAIIASLSEHTPGMLHLVLPSDHLIEQDADFHDAVASAAAAAKDEHIVLFGITPTAPDTGYGYIVPGQPVESGPICKVGVFTEKPNETFARVLISQGALWNSGMALYDPKLLCEEALKLAPGHYAKCQAAVNNAQHERKCILLRHEDYADMETRPLDTLILERTQRCLVLPCQLGWSDVGTWSSVMNLSDKDANGNALLGPVICKDVRNSYIRSEGALIAALGMEDCMVVSTHDHVLVAKTSRAQEVKELLSILEATSPKNAAAPSSGHYVFRPWGKYKTIAEGTHFIIKQLIIWPESSISLQIHHHRSEHWIVVSGIARAECDGVATTVLANESVFVPKQAKHRLTNIGEEDLHIIEIQSGDYLSEDDIVRFEDAYGRV